MGRVRWMLAGCLGLFLTEAAVAGGIYFPYLGARAAGMGTAFVAKADDATSIFHNPAGMLLIKGDQVSFSMHLNVPDFHFTRRTGGVTFPEVSLESRMNPQPYLGYVTSRPEQRYAVGIATYAAWGGLPDWPDEGPQRYILDYFRLVILHNTVAGAYKVAKGLYVGAAGSLIYASLGQRKSIDARDLLGLDTLIDPAVDDSGNEIRATIAAKDWAFGGHLGVLYQPTPWLRVGAMYTAPVTLKFEGTIESDVSRVTLLSSLIGDVIDAKATVEQPLPQIFRVGVAAAPVRALTLAADWTWQGWSVAKENTVLIQEQPLLEVLIDGKIVVPRHWEDSWGLSVGAEYKLGGGHALRAGYFFDKGAIPLTTVSVDDPDADKTAFTAGGTVAIGKDLLIDLAGEYRKYDDIEVTNSAHDFSQNPEPNYIGGNTNGSYRSSILGLALGVRYRFNTGEN